MPDIDPVVRAKTKEIFQQQGLEGLRTTLQNLDPEYFAEVDQNNPNRMMRGIEISLSTGQKFSTFRTRQTKSRPFNIKKIIINRPRQDMAQRIDLRTRQMVEDGIIEEAIAFFKYRHLNALNTVGYKELFAWLGNRCTLHEAIEQIKTNTRRYAKRQITWFKRYEDAEWFLPGEIKDIIHFAKK
jgi:tRNA dimethylallyltransferase